MHNPQNDALVRDGAELAGKALYAVFKGCKLETHIAGTLSFNGELFQLIFAKIGNSEPDKIDVK